MSAYVVEKCHINAMLRAGMYSSSNPLHWRFAGEWKTLTTHNADEIGQMLLDENIKAVRCRYPDCGISDLPGRVDAEYLIPFKFEMFTRMPTGVEAIKIARCYVYQSCEDEEFEQTEACAFVNALITHSFSRLPGYEAACWDWVENRKAAVA